MKITKQQILPLSTIVLGLVVIILGTNLYLLKKELNYIYSSPKKYMERYEAREKAALRSELDEKRKKGTLLSSIKTEDMFFVLPDSVVATRPELVSLCKTLQEKLKRKEIDDKAFIAEMKKNNGSCTLAGRTLFYFLDRDANTKTIKLRLATGYNPVTIWWGKEDSIIPARYQSLY